MMKSFGWREDGELNCCRGTYVGNARALADDAVDLLDHHFQTAGCGGCVRCEV